MKASRRTPRAWACAVTAAAAVCCACWPPHPWRAHACPHIPGNEIEAENCNARIAGVAVGRRRRGQSRDPGLRHRHQRRRRARRVDFKVDTPASNYRLEIYRMGWYGGAGARLRDHGPAERDALPRPSPSCHREDDDHRARRLRQLGGVGSVERPCGRDVRHLLRKAGPRGRRLREARTSSSSSATTTGGPTCCSRRRTRRGRPTTGTAATACTSVARPAAPTRSPTTGRFTTRGTSEEDWRLQQRVPDGPLAGAQRLRRLLLHGRRQRPARRRDPRAQGLPVRRPRRVLVGRPARERRGGPRCRREPRLLQRQRGVLEDPLGGRAPHAGLLQGDAREREDRSGARRLDGHLARPASLQSRRAPGPRTRSRERCSASTPGTRAIQVPGGRGPAASVAQRRALPPDRARATLAARHLGYEWDEDVDNGARPPGLVRLSSTTVPDVEKLLDHGSNYGPGTATHRLTLYRDTNGAGRSARVRRRHRAVVVGPRQRARRRRLGPERCRCSRRRSTCSPTCCVQPRTLQTGLPGRRPRPIRLRRPRPRRHADTASSPPAARSPSAARPRDSGGGRVGGVEVSVDGGATWHPATGRESWSYTWTPAVSGQVTVRSRAVDDSGNLEGGRHGLAAACGTPSPLGGPTPPPGGPPKDLTAPRVRGMAAPGASVAPALGGVARALPAGRAAVPHRSPAAPRTDDHWRASSSPRGRQDPARLAPPDALRAPPAGAFAVACGRRGGGCPRCGRQPAPRPAPLSDCWPHGGDDLTRRLIAKLLTFVLTLAVVAGSPAPPRPSRRVRGRAVRFSSSAIRGSLRSLLRRDPDRGGPQRLRGAERRSGLRRHAQRLQRRDPGAERRVALAGVEPVGLGAGRRQPDRDAARPVTGRSARARERHRQPRQRLHQGQHQLWPGSRHHRRHHAVPRPGGPLDGRRAPPGSPISTPARRRPRRTRP